jgi:hypothetical protein
MTSPACSRSWILSLAALGCVAAACSSASEPPTGSTSEAVLPGVHPPPPPACLSNASTCLSAPKETPGFDPAYGPPQYGLNPRYSEGCGAEDTAFEANLASHFCTPEQYYYQLGEDGVEIPGPVWATSFCEGIFPTNGSTEGWISCDSCTGNPPREGWYAVAWLTQDQCASMPEPATGCTCVTCLQASQGSQTGYGQ